MNEAFLYDNYGLYPDNVNDDSFIIDKYLYKLEEVNDKSEDDLLKMNLFLEEMYPLFNGLYSKIVYNKQNKLISRSIRGSYCLVYSLIGRISYKDVLAFNLAYKKENDLGYSLSKMRDIWIEKMTNIKTSYLDSLKSDSKCFKEVLSALSLALGLGENAISYLVDIKEDYGDKITRITLNHVRLNSFDSYSFLNPLNFIYDSVVRDVCELYKYELIDLKELGDYIDKLQIDKVEASLLMARILFPTRIFDLVEENYLCQNFDFDSNYDYLRSLDKMLQRIKNVHLFLVRKYNIRPIIWLKE